MCARKRHRLTADQPGRRGEASRSSATVLGRGPIAVPRSIVSSARWHGGAPAGAKGRTIKRNEHEDLIVAHQAKMQTPEAKAIYRKRGQTVELRFADAKAHRGLRRLSGRGLERVRIEVGLCVLAHDLLVVRAAGQRKAADGQNGTSCQDAA